MRSDWPRPVARSGLGEQKRVVLSGSARVPCQRSQGLEPWRRQQIRRCSPAPVAVRRARPIHPSVCPQIDNVLQRRHGERSDRRPRQIEQRRRGVPRCLRGARQRATDGAALSRADRRTIPAWSDCRACRCRRPCCERSCRAGAGCRDSRRMRTAGRGFPESQTRREGCSHPP